MAGLPRLAGRIGVRGRLRPLRETGLASCSRRRGRGGQSLGRGGYPPLRAEEGRAAPCREGWKGIPRPGRWRGGRRAWGTLRDARASSSQRPSLTLGRSPSAGHLGDTVCFAGGILEAHFCFLVFFAFSFPPSAFTGHAILGAFSQPLSSHGFMADPSRRPPVTCPLGCNLALHKGSSPKPRRDTERIRRGRVGRRDGDTGRSPEQRGERFGPVGALGERSRQSEPCGFWVRCPS